MAVLRSVDASPPSSAGGQEVDSTQATSQPVPSHQSSTPGDEAHPSEEPVGTNAPPPCKGEKDDASKNPNNTNKKEEEQPAPQPTLPKSDPPNPDALKSWEVWAEEEPDELKEHLDLVWKPVQEFLCLARDNGPLNGHVSLLLRDWRRQRERKRKEKLRQAAQTPQGQGENHASGSGDQDQAAEQAQVHVAVDDDDENRPLCPTEAELAMGMGIVTSWIIACYFGFCIVEYELKQTGEQPPKYYWLAKPLSSWSCKLATWVGIRCLYRLWESWWRGGFEGGRGLGSSTLLLFMLAAPCAVMACLFASWEEFWTWPSLLGLLVRSICS